MPVHARTLVSEAEFLALPESVDKVELVDGEVVASPSPTFWHQELLRRLVVALSLWASKREDAVTVAQAPLDVRFAAGRILQPDAMVFLGKLQPDHVGPVDRIPEICIEVLSGNSIYDRVTKRFLYAEAGVREYWVLDPSGVAERWDEPGLRRAEVIDAVLRSPLLPGFTLDLAELFRR